MNLSKLLLGSSTSTNTTTPRSFEPETGEFFQQHHESLATSFGQAGIGIVETDIVGEDSVRECSDLRFDGLCRPRNCKVVLFLRKLTPMTPAWIANNTCGKLPAKFDRYSTEKRIRRKDGTYFWSAIISSAVRDEAGRFVSAVRVQLDVGDRKRERKESHAQRRCRSYQRSMSSPRVCKLL